MMSDEQRTHDEVLATHGDAAGGGQDDSVTEAVPQLDQPGNEQGGKARRRRRSGKRRGRLSFLTEMVVLFAVALTIALLIKTFVVQPFFIPSGSMENTLLIGDKVLVNKLVYDIRPIGRGDIVVFSGQGSWNPPATSHPQSGNPLVRVYDATLGALFHSIAGLFGTVPGQTDYIKRVIGIPGDRVICCNSQGLITVNGVPLHEGSYLIPGAQPSHGRFDVVVPPGRLWVMGDNRPESADSRLHDCGYADPGVTCVPYDRDGTIPESKVIGRAFLIVWPPSRIRILPVPSTFNQAGLSQAAGSAGPGPAIAGGTLQVRPSAPYLPLGMGLAAVAPLTLIRRRLRLRACRRRDSRRPRLR
ncbi:MAG TPA: signal peptidase I [Streptosporangiaceae bacterium]|nr:signal peptidase I [Streptosporangiaceae bacterium]